MNTSQIYARSFLNRATIWMLLCLLLTPVTPALAAPFAANAIDGDGALTVSPTSVVYDSSTTFNFTFTADTGDFVSGTQVVIYIPAGWTAPSNSGAGRVTIASHNCTLRSPGAEIAGFDSTSVSVDMGCAQGETFTLSYANAKPGDVSGSPFTFTTTTEVPGGVAPAEIAAPPTVEVTPKPITVSSSGLTPGNKTYDGDTSVPTLTIGSPSLVGTVTGDVVSLDTSGAVGTFDNRNAGTGKTVTISGLTLTGADAGNYSLTDPNRTASINKLPITVNAATDSKTYDGTTTSGGTPTLSAGTPLVAGDTEPTWTQTFATKHAGTGKSIIPAGLVNDGNSGLNYAYTYAPNTSGVITQLGITVTAATDSKVYDGSTTSDGLPTLSAGTPLAGGDSEPTWTQTFDNKNIGTGKTLTPAGLVSDGNNGANYSYNFVTNTTGEITALPITVTANALSKAEGSTDPTLTYTSDPALFAGDSFSGALTRVAGETPGPYAISQGTLSAGSNYSISFVGANLTINPKISGSAGVSGVTLKYNDGGAKNVVSGAGGAYTLVVSYGWSGAVTPSKTGYTFSPTHKDYVNVTTSKGGQNYVAITERVKNGGFNTYIGASKIPQYWVASGFAPSDGKYTLIKKEGLASIKIVGAVGKTKTLAQTLALSGPIGSKLTFSFWVRGSSIPVAGLCQAQVYLYNGTTLKKTYLVNCPTGSYAAFQKKTLVITAPAAYTKVLVKFIYTKASGTVWFDLASLLK